MKKHSDTGDKIKRHQRCSRSVRMPCGRNVYVQASHRHTCIVSRCLLLSWLSVFPGTFRIPYKDLHELLRFTKNGVDWPFELHQRVQGIHAILVCQMLTMLTWWPCNQFWSQSRMAPAFKFTFQGIIDSSCGEKKTVCVCTLRYRAKQKNSTKEMLKDSQS